ncbi:MAG: hypothetical protein D6744_05385, partial [Planctomycetota bacterium]
MTDTNQRRRRVWLTVFACAFAAAAAQIAGAQSVRADLKWVEVEVALDPSGKAMVQYKLRWNVQRGTMGGFYFQGESAAIQWHRPGCGALTAGNRQIRYQLDLRDLGDRWDVLLADGQRYGPGEITYVLTYFADYGAAGYFAKTRSPEHGDLVAFNWAPVQWDESLEHYTIYVRWPIRIDRDELTFEQVTRLGLRTPKEVNERYLLSFLGRRGTAVTPPVEPSEGDRYLVIRAHRNDIRAREKCQVTYYFPQELIPDLKLGAFATPSRGATTSRRPPQTPRTPPRSRIAQSLSDTRQRTAMMLAGAFVVILLTVSATLVLQKHRSMVRAADMLEALQWERDDWVVPQIELKSFRHNGKVAKLNVIEAGYLCEIPLKSLVALMLLEMERRGILDILSKEPIRVRVHDQLPSDLTPYHQLLLDSFGADGALDPGLPERLVRVITGGIQEKAWDCDLQATRAHYEKEFAKQARAAKRRAERFWLGEDPTYDHRWHYYYPYYHSHLHHRQDYA